MAAGRFPGDRGARMQRQQTESNLLLLRLNGTYKNRKKGGPMVDAVAQRRRTKAGTVSKSPRRNRERRSRDEKSTGHARER